MLGTRGSDMNISYAANQISTSHLRALSQGLNSIFGFVVDFL